jgi:hypothetical protein
MERFSLKKLNEIWGKEQYRVDISNRFSALENAEVESVRENIKISAEDSIGYYK